MKLNESKDKIPATFITSYISDAWEKIGYINEDINAIKKEYSDTKIVVECLQDIVDAYLVAAGRLQAYLDGKEHIDIGAAEENQGAKVKENLVIKEELTSANETPQVQTNIPNVSPAVKPVLESLAKENSVGEAFEYTCDFDEPDALDVSQIELDPNIFGNIR